MIIIQFPGAMKMNAGKEKNLHEGSALGHSVEDIKNICPKAKGENAIAFYGNSVSKVKEEVKKWIEECK